MAVTATNFEIQEDEAFSDEEVSENAHHKLLDAVSKLYNKQRIEVPKHREPAQEKSDFKFNLGIEEESNNLRGKVNDLLGDLKERATHRYITKQVKVSQRKIKKLPKPLEKIEEQKITRKVGYENVKYQLNKWSSIVERNKLSSQLVFPLPSTQKVNKKSNTYSFLTTFKEPTELEKEMAKVLDKSAIAKEEVKEEAKLSKLTIEEMIERRNMTAKMRARESYRIAKAIRQNKIKSKKYHRILKKERIKQELKDFEKLQKTDPEAALEKLEQIERARAEERISLRHRNTGKWARSKAIRAKYDTKARIQLAEQLSKSRELTRKLKENINSSSEDESEDENDNDKNNTSTNIQKANEKGSSDNPWVSDYDQFISGYQKFSSEKSNHISNIEQNKSIPPQENNEKVQTESEAFPSTTPTPNTSKSSVKGDVDIQENQLKEDENNIITISNESNNSQSEDEEEEEEEAINLDEINSDDDDNSSKPSRKNASINEMFDEAEEVLKDHVAAVSVKIMKSNLKLDNDIEEDVEENVEEPKKFGFKKSTRLHDIDAALIEIAHEGISSGLNDLSVLKEKLNLSESKKEIEPQIDPDKLITVKPKKLASELPDLDEGGDDDSEDEEKEKHLNLMEAFAEDDIVDQFRQEKKEEEKKSKAKKIDLTMPGWGDWGGTGVEVEKKKSKRKRKTRRLIMKFPELPRKDKKKPNVIINEDPVPKLREQLVNELPYPFTSVKDFEASIRAPIGKNWVTERGFKKLTAPPVVTKMGTIIEPMDDSLLTKKLKKRMNINKPNFNSKKQKK